MQMRQLRLGSGREKRPAEVMSRKQHPGEGKTAGLTADVGKRLRISEGMANAGLLLICVSLVIPFFNPADLAMVKCLKWVYAAGALIYVVARVIGANVPGESVRLRRLRRMEFWGGVAFLIGAAFWFYTEIHLGPYAGMLALLRQTILFTLVGAVIQVIASWMIVDRRRKESQSDDSEGRKERER